MCLALTLGDFEDAPGCLEKLFSVDPEMTNLPDISVILKILSPEYQPYAPQGHFLQSACGKIFRAPCLPRRAWAWISTKFACFWMDTIRCPSENSILETFSWEIYQVSICHIRWLHPNPLPRGRGNKQAGEWFYQEWIARSPLLRIPAIFGFIRGRFRVFRVFSGFFLS